MPITISTSKGVTNGDDSPQPVSMRPRTAKAPEIPLALKKTQPRQTNWNVQNRCSHMRTGPSATGGNPCCTRRRRRKCPTPCPIPCRAPQNTNVHAAPCHNPPRTMVIMMLRIVLASEPLLPPSGM